MKPRTERFIFVLFGLACLAGAVALTLRAFTDNIVFFYAPAELQTKKLAPGQVIRIGGLVQEGSIRRQEEGLVTEFVLTDGAASIAVRYTGLLPDLFREGQGIVARGRLSSPAHFVADELLAKHDENYMPPEVAKALKASGHWQEGIDKKSDRMP